VGDGEISYGGRAKGPKRTRVEEPREMELYNGKRAVPNKGKEEIRFEGVRYPRYR